MTIPKFTFIEPETTEAVAGMICDPVTGLCGPLPKETDEPVEKGEADE